MPVSEAVITPRNDAGASPAGAALDEAKDASGAALDDAKDASPAGAFAALDDPKEVASSFGGGFVALSPGRARDEVFATVAASSSSAMVKVGASFFTTFM